MNLQPTKLASNFIKSPRPPVWVNAILLIILAFWLAPLVWNLFVEQPKTAAKVIGTEAAKITNIRYGQEISNLHIFGKAIVAPVAKVEQKPKELPLSRLNLVLKGVLANNPQEFAYALVAQGSGNVEVYGVGDTIASGAKLLEVYADRIVIDYNSRHETVMLQELQSVDLGNSAPSPPSESHSDAPAVVGGKVNINPLRATALRQDFLSNPTKLLNMVSIKPYMQNGAMVGYTINPKGDPALYNELGLMPNDVVVSVNGIGITDIPNLNKLTTASSYDVMLLRDGQQMSLSLSFQ